MLLMNAGIDRLVAELFLRYSSHSLVSTSRSSYTDALASAGSESAWTRRIAVAAEMLRRAVSPATTEIARATCLQRGSALASARSSTRSAAVRASGNVRHCTVLLSQHDASSLK